MANEFNSLYIQPSISRIHLAVVGMLYLLALLAILYVSLPLWIKAVIVCLVVLAWVGGKYFIKHKVIKNSCYYQGQWTLIDAENQPHAAILLGDSYISSWLIILRFRLIESDVKRTILLWRDSLSRNTWRRLRVAVTRSQDPGSRI